MPGNRSVALAMQGDAVADRALGQADFTCNSSNFFDLRNL